MAPQDRNSDPAHAVVLSILREAQQVALAPLLRTTLLKFVYLVDLYVAEETGGKTFTECRWLFLHFGPFAPDLAASIDELAGRGEIFVDRGYKGEEAEFKQYTLRRGLGSPLRDIGVPPSVSLRIGADLRRYARNLPALLDYVYFRTTPMVDAIPGRALDFSRCERTDIKAFKPVTMRQIPDKQLRDARAKLRSLARDRESEKQRFTTGPYDEAYFEGIAALEADSLPTGLTGQAKIRNE